MDLIPTAFNLIGYDMMVSTLVDQIHSGELSFEDEVVQQCIASTFLTGHLKLLRVCARELTDAHKDYKTVMKFIDRLQEIRDKELAKGSIQVVE